jgi:hypothetical protein
MTRTPLSCNENTATEAAARSIPISGTGAFGDSSVATRRKASTPTDNASVGRCSWSAPAANESTWAGRVSPSIGTPVILVS